jgi:predicted nucleic acid-binding protein
VRRSTARPLHAPAIRAIDAADGDGHVSGQVLREFLVVATRPVDAHGLGLDVKSALGNVDVFLGRLKLLAENPDVALQLRALVREHECRGKQIQDANVAATMLAHGMQTLVTANPAHFARFTDRLSVRDLAAV